MRGASTTPRRKAAPFWWHAVEDPALPTVLTYGHGDVVNGQDAQWREGRSPRELTIEGERWYGWGTADNKASTP